jgi:hypothetical protein
MPSLEVVQTNFTRGELSPRLRGRLDFEGFFNGVAKMRDFLPVVQGAAVKRPGTRHVARQDTAERLVPFEFSVEQTYVLGFADGNVEFYTDKPTPSITTGVTSSIRAPKERLKAPVPNFTLQNGGFDSDLSGWTTNSGGSSSVVQNEGRAELQAVPGEVATLEQEITVSLTDFVLDHFLRFDIGTVAAKKSQGVIVRVGTSSGASDVFRRVLRPGSHVIKFNPPDRNNVFLAFELNDPDADSTVFVDNIEKIEGEPIRLKTPYGADEVDKLFWAQSADILYMTHANHLPRELRRFSREEFSLVFYDYQDGPWDDVNLTETTLETGAATGRTTITASSTEGINGGAGFKASDVGRLVRFQPDDKETKSIQGDGSTNVFTFGFAVATEDDVRVTLTNTGSGTVQNIGEGATIEAIPEVDYKLTLNEDSAGGDIDFSISKPPASDIEVNITRDNTFWGWAEIVSFTDSLNVEAIIRNEDGLAGTGPSTTWRLGTWTGTNSGFPQVVTFHDQRLAFGSSFRSPQSLWLSKVAAFDNHSPTEPDSTVNADNAINVKLATSQVNFIRWLSSFSNGLAIGTSGSEFLLRKGGTAEPLSPENVEVQKQTRRGSAPFTPEANIGHSIFFLQRDRQTLREAAFDFDTNGLIARDLSVFSEHLLRPGITRMAYQQSPESILWLLTTEGNLVALTIESDQNVFSWTQHSVSGTVKSLTTITDPASEDDQLWVLVEREINGSTVRHVDFLENFWFEDRDGIEEAYFVDAGITVDDTANGVDQVAKGLDHLEGEEVAILADGAVADRKTVTNGQIEIETNTESRRGNTVHIGLPYTPIIETFPYDQGQRGSTTRGKVKRISEIEILFHETVGALYGRNTFDRVLFRDSANNMNRAVPPFTGPRAVSMPSDFKPEAFVIIKSDQPLPATILTLTVDMVFEDL